MLIHDNSLIDFTDKEPKDFMVPSKWGSVRMIRVGWRDVGFAC